MLIENYIPVLIHFCIVLGIGIFILSISHIFGQKAKYNKIKNTPYECGIFENEKIQLRFPVKFYITAMLFILFDIEMIFLVPWALIYREFLAAEITILFPVLFFIFLLIVTFIYEIKKGALEWKN